MDKEVSFIGPFDDAQKALERVLEEGGFPIYLLGSFVLPASNGVFVEDEESFQDEFESMLEISPVGEVSFSRDAPYVLN